MPLGCLVCSGDAAVMLARDASANAAQGEQIGWEYCREEPGPRCQRCIESTVAADRRERGSERLALAYV